MRGMTGGGVRRLRRPPTVSTLAAWARIPASDCATEMERNHTPIISPTTRAIDSLVIMLSPTGEMHSSAIDWIR